MKTIKILNAITFVPHSEFNRQKLFTLQELKPEQMFTSYCGKNCHTSLNMSQIQLTSPFQNTEDKNTPELLKE